MKPLALEAADLLHKELKLPKEKIMLTLEVPPDPKLGDLSFPCFSLSKILKKNPSEIAKDLANKLRPVGLIKEIKTAGPYINFFIDNLMLTELIINQILKEKSRYGVRQKKKEVVLVEFPGPNTNKPLHLGHVRNMLLGESVSRILETNGYNVKRVNVVNDRGIHICKSLLAYMKWGKGKKPNKKGDHFVGDYYIMFAQKVKENPKLEQEAQELLKKWEARDKEVLKVWKQMNDWVYKGFNETYKKFGIKHDKEYYESKTYKKGKDVIFDGLKKGLFYKTENGAIAINLGPQLGEKILLRSNGTAVYATQDIAMALERYKDYRFDKMVYVVASEQNYHFQVLFKLFGILGFPFANSCYHLSYGMVNLPSGKMKSREGTVIDADDLLEEVKTAAIKEIKARQNLSEKEISKISEKIALAAIKLFMLKYAATNDFTFDPKKSISFEGETGPYLQYSEVRARRILEQEKPRKADLSLLTEPEELALVKLLAQYPELVEKAAENYSPHIIANYALDLASSFNTFYTKHRVLQGEDKKTKIARLKLVAAFSQVINNCFNLLGLEVVSVM